MVSKNANGQEPVPQEWRRVLFDIVDSLKEGDFALSKLMASVQPVDEVVAARIREAINSYGAHLISLPEDTWATSACQWMEGYWDVLVDLFTVEEGPSDLALAVRVYEMPGGYSFRVLSVYVP